MTLKTRLDSRAEGNKSFEIIDKDGNTVANIKLLDGPSSTIEVSTSEGMYIEKPNGWNSKGGDG